MIDSENASFYERIKKGLEDSVRYSRGELNLRTVELPLPPPHISASGVAALRRRLRMSQAVFAATLNVSTKLVQSWEQGSRRPARSDLRLLQILREEPKVLNVFAPSAMRKHPRMSPENGARGLHDDFMADCDQPKRAERRTAL